MNLPEGFPPLDDLLPSNPKTYDPPEVRDLSKLFTDGNSPIWDWNIGHHPLRKQPLYVQGYYGCLVDIWCMTGLCVKMQISIHAVDVAVECCNRWGRIHRFSVPPVLGDKLAWLEIGAAGQASWNDPVPEKHHVEHKEGE